MQAASGSVIQSTMQYSHALSGQYCVAPHCFPPPAWDLALCASAGLTLHMMSGVLLGGWMATRALPSESRRISSSCQSTSP